MRPGSGDWVRRHPTSWLRRVFTGYTGRRRHTVLVDEDAFRRLAELAVLGEAYAIVEHAEADWLNLESGD